MNGPNRVHMQTKNSGLLYCCLCNTSHGYGKHKCASAFGLLSGFGTTIRLKLNGSKEVKWACHSPAVSAFIMPDAIVPFHCGQAACTTAALALAAAVPLWAFFQQNCFYLAASGHLSQESRASPFCCFATRSWNSPPCRVSNFALS